MVCRFGLVVPTVGAGAINRSCSGIYGMSILQKQKSLTPQSRKKRIFRDALKRWQTPSYYQSQAMPLYKSAWQSRFDAQCWLHCHNCVIVDVVFICRRRTAGWPTTLSHFYFWRWFRLFITQATAHPWIDSAFLAHQVNSRVFGKCYL
jgi:hypothetical protein